jgi:probable rRNA maturation factor
MSKINLIIDSSKKRLWLGKSNIVYEAIIKTLQAIISLREILSCKICLISVRMTDNDEIQVINKRFRGKDKPTNVLSFQSVDWKLNQFEELPLQFISITRGKYIYEISDSSFRKITTSKMINSEKVINMGDIVLSYEQIFNEANEQSKDFDNYLKFITVHGVLHLLGYDHQTKEEEQEMILMEKSIMENK